MLKRDLRLSHLQLRAQLSDSDILQKSKEVLRYVVDVPIWNFQTFHVFLTIPGKKEVDTSPLITHLHKTGKRVVVPKVLAHGELEHYLLEPDTRLVKNSWGIPEPIGGQVVLPREIEVVFIPLLAYDPKGNRVGYGGGYYDRFLAACSPDTVGVGLSFFSPAEEISDVEATDRPLDYCIHPDGVLKFPGRFV